jgi:hypothetical protein
MTHLNFQEKFSFTVTVAKSDAVEIVEKLNATKLPVFHEASKTAPAMVEITVVCLKGLNDAAKAIAIINPIQ